MRGSGVTLTVPAEIMAMPRFHATIKLSAKWMREKSQHKNSFVLDAENELWSSKYKWIKVDGSSFAGAWGENETVYFLWNSFYKAFMKEFGINLCVCVKSLKLGFKNSLALMKQVENGTW